MQTKSTFNPIVRLLFLLALIVAGLSGCSETTKVEERALSAVHIDNSDECHLCGMVINQFPGPKGQLFEKNKQTVRKFCSTNDLFSYALQPEHKHNLQKILVHDMSNAQWDNPQETGFIDAKDAWYVSNHKLPGAMGPTIASFKTQVAAEQFIQKNGGQVLSYKDITLSLMAKLNKPQMHRMH